MLSRKVLVLGGLGDVGGLMAALLQSAGASVILVDARLGPVDLSQDLDAAWVPAFAQALSEADLVLAALPEAVCLRAVDRVLGHMRSDALWVDTLSVKDAICRALTSAPAPAERLSINPMFAPALGWEGQCVAWVEVASGQRTAEIRAIVQGAGARIEPIDAAAHDRVTAATQVATHAAILAFGMALRQSGYDAETVWRLATPPHRILAALLARIVNGNPEVYGDIQSHHPSASQVRASLVAGLERLDSLAARNAGQEFVAEVASLRDLLSPASKELAELGERLVRASRH